MKKVNLKYCKVVFIISFVILAGCKKNFLDDKPNSNIVVPSTLTDMVQLLDNLSKMSSNSPSLGILSGDEYYFPTVEIYNSTPSYTERNCYLWNSDIYGPELAIQDWNGPYATVFTANVVLEQWEKLSDNDKASEIGKNVKAWALFCRSFSFYNLAQIFCPVYNKATAAKDLGLPLKLSANINVIEQRTSLEKTYNQIVTDLESSISMFSNSFPSQKRNRASKVAAYALLSRIYLSIGDYEKALVYSNKGLSSYDKLLDYNNLDLNSNSPFSLTHDELILYNTSILSYYNTVGAAPADPSLIALYEDNDLRKQIFYSYQDGYYSMKDNYSSTSYPFTGLAVDEIYLIKAECLSRAGDQLGATSVLNSLLIKRYKTGTFISFESNSPQVVLNRILVERRKELVRRGLRWSDLKRLNLEGANITLTRNLGGKIYILPANDPRYVMPIPSDEIAYSHIEQNKR